ncbi:hypothetical protein ACFVWY_05555 [Streptomyces sp. NPDC058195]|uniref:hypothetical protein n=1 Tax=Streptomyces sp. NPDC058195 TaxID=3346375 RepID=UPI0036E2950A
MDHHLQKLSRFHLKLERLSGHNSVIPSQVRGLGTGLSTLDQLVMTPDSFRQLLAALDTVYAIARAA